MNNGTLSLQKTTGWHSGGGAMTGRTSLRLSASRLLAGQLPFIVITRFHAGGSANHYAAIFAEYARDGIWTAVHLGQFAGMAILLTGLLVLFSALDIKRGTASSAAWFGR